MRDIIRDSGFPIEECPAGCEVDINVEVNLSTVP